METSCPGRIEEISAFLDGELDRDEELELRRHLDDCELCAAWHGRLHGFSEGLARSLGRERAPASLAQRIGILQRRTWPRRVGIGWVGIAAAVLAAVLLGRTTGDVEAPNERAALQLIEDHRRWISGETALAVSSSDAGEIARGLSARLPFQLAVAGIAGSHLRGGQDCSLAEGRAAYLQYELAGELVSVFVAPHLEAGLEAGIGDGTGDGAGDDDGRNDARAGAGGAAGVGGAVGAGKEICRTIAGETLCTFRGPQQTVAVVANRPETARVFQRAAWIVVPH